MNWMRVRMPGGRRAWAPVYEAHEWACLPWYLKLYSWAAFIAAVARGVCP